MAKIRNKTQILNQKDEKKEEIDFMAENEQTRAWIRKKNCKLYDEKIKNMVQITNSGSDLLRMEIEESDNRLQLIKSG